MEQRNLLLELTIRKMEEKLDWEAYKCKGLTFPPLYRVFQETYHIESYNGESSYSCFLDSENRAFNFGVFVFSFGDLDVGLGNFIAPSDVKRLIKEVLEKKIFKAQMFPIGITNFNQFLLVGFGKNNLDQIFIQEEPEEKAIKISDNIFDFCRKINLIPEKRSFLDKGYEELYKKWGEKFWRKE